MLIMSRSRYWLGRLRGNPVKLLRVSSPVCVKNVMRGGSLRVDKGTDILVVGTNIGSPDQILVLKAKVFREVLPIFEIR